MKKLSAVLLCVAAAAAVGSLCFDASQAWAGEHWLGTIRVWDGGSSNNCETSVLSIDGGSYNTGTPFQTIPGPGPISVQCVTDAFIGTDVRYCDAGNCLRLGAGLLLPTTTSTIRSPYTFNLQTGYAATDGGNQGTTSTTCNSGMVAIGCTDGGRYCECSVYSRLGNE